MIFAREVSDSLVSLIKKLDKVAVDNSGAKVNAFAVFLNDSPALEGKLKDLVKSAGLSKFVLSIDNPAGPEPYKVAKDADVTVVLYTKSKVVANHTFKKGSLNEKAIEAIMADVPKILSK